MDFFYHVKFDIIFITIGKKETFYVILLNMFSWHDKLKDSSIQFINADQSEIFYSRSTTWQQLSYSHWCEWQLEALISSTSAGPESSKNHYSSDSVSSSLNAKNSNQS